MDKNYTKMEMDELMEYSYKGKHSLRVKIPDGLYRISEVPNYKSKDIDYTIDFKPNDNSEWGLFMIHEDETKIAGCFGTKDETVIQNILFIIRSNVNQCIDMTMEDGWITNLQCDDPKNIKDHLM